LDVGKANSNQLDEDNKPLGQYNYISMGILTGRKAIGCTWCHRPNSIAEKNSTNGIVRGFGIVRMSLNRKQKPIVYQYHRHDKKANSKPELSQLLFINIRQRELIRVLAVLG